MKFVKIYILIHLFSSLALYAQESNRYELTKIDFIGNNAITDVELSNVIYSKESPNWFLQFLNDFSGFGEPPVYFDSLLIKSDIEAIKKLYISRGYFNIDVEYKYTYEGEDSFVFLTYLITENNPVFFNKLIVKGLENLPKEFQPELKDYLSVDTTSVYSAEFVEKTYFEVTKFLKDNGYMLAESVKPMVEVDTTKHTADLEFDFRTGKRYRISEVRVSKTGPGKDFVEDELMREIAGIDTGQFYSNFDLQRAQVRLYRTNLFSSALVSSVVADTFDSRVPLSISVDINKMHELSPELIMNNEDNTFNLGLGLGFSRKNFIGSARKLSLNTSAAAQNIFDLLSNLSVDDTTFLGYADVRAAMEQPFLFGKPINTKLETYYTLQKRKNEYNSNIYGAKLSLDFELPQYTYFTSLTTYFNWESAEYIYKRSYIRDNLRFAFERDLGGSSASIDSLVNYFMDSIIVRNSYRTDNTLFGVELGAAHVDNLLFPTRGYSLSIILEDGNTISYLISRLNGKDFGSPQYAKVFINSSFYFPFFYEKTSSLGMKLKVGNIFTYRGSRANISFNQRFYAGGSNSIRGWGSRELVPQDPEVDITAPNENFNSILLTGISPGGFFLVETSVEMRRRIIGSLGYALFADIGNAWNEAKNFRYDELAVAAGFGLRFYTDFVPLRVDFGFKMYDPFDRRSLHSRLNDSGGFWNIFQFHLGIGEAF